MAYERIGDASLDYVPCRYGASKLLFRGPRRSLSGAYAVFLGGTETYGKFIARPYPALVEARTGLKCVNFGWPNAGVDVFLNDADVLAAASGSAVTVLQVPPAPNMSNRFYRVHPRRNDRFLEASAMLRAIYGEVDFTEFHFTRHMLGRLHDLSPERFALVREELQAAWRARMRLLVDHIAAPVVLLWMSRHPMRGAADVPDIAEDPALVTREMVGEIAPLVHATIDATTSAAAREAGTAGMVFSEFEAPAAAELPNPAAHVEVADKLVAPLTGIVAPE
ncbi:hypothetical protein K1T73_05465 [Roseovarius sp. SCSIO 43702]|uniref:DUF6473 family protein n=1 Tax=Roseovarius sp. SCSIO 43702 TaxID=2823043 RepID=UPI001C737DC8|nr:DUF6473 family protein [Roseovarius sp. SCSIO 43702]QYX57837.1 hypothetical protein K1T73_05465 [Roseovarius sp. SCSIO 43702]